MPENVPSGCEQFQVPTRNWTDAIFCCTAGDASVHVDAAKNAAATAANKPGFRLMIPPLNDDAPASARVASFDHLVDWLRGGKPAREIVFQPSGLRFGCNELHATADNPGSRTATTSMVAEPVTTPVVAGAATFDAASMRGSRLSESIFAGMTTNTPMVIPVMATAAIPKATRGIEVS